MCPSSFLGVLQPVPEKHGWQSLTAPAAEVSKLIPSYHAHWMHVNVLITVTIRLTYPSGCGQRLKVCVYTGSEGAVYTGPSGARRAKSNSAFRADLPRMVKGMALRVYRAALRSAWTVGFAWLCIVNGLSAVRTAIQLDSVPAVEGIIFRVSSLVVSFFRAERVCRSHVVNRAAV